jgi:5-methyltetrahydropteroyltriglutamate--homocysteine methyltransferase
VPGPYTLSGRLVPGKIYRDRYAVTEALRPMVRRELESLVAAGCSEICVDEPSMSCYAHKEDTKRFVDIFNRTVESVAGKCRLSTHLCFGNYKGRAVGPRKYAPMFPAFLDMKVDEIHVEMASREFAEIEIIKTIAAKKDVAVGGCWLINCIKAEGAARLTKAGQAPKVLAGSAVVGAEEATRLFEAAYDEHARRLAKLYEDIGL